MQLAHAHSVEIFISGDQTNPRFWDDFRPLKVLRANTIQHRSHARVICIDGNIGWTGGFGLADKWYGNGRDKDQWRDSNVRFSGPAVRQLQATFAACWGEAAGELLIGPMLFPPPASASRRRSPSVTSAPSAADTWCFCRAPVRSSPSWTRSHMPCDASSEGGAHPPGCSSRSATLAPSPARWSICRMRTFATALAALILIAGTAAAQPRPVMHPVWRDLGPDQSSTHAMVPDAASGGRVNGLAASHDKSMIFAASEWGGLWKSLDTGRTWRHVDSHLPVATWRVAVDPTNASRVYATSFYDGRVESLAGINVSADGGGSWIHPATSVPAPGSCASGDRARNPSAFGIAISPRDAREVLVGTNCGLLRSVDAGVTWTRLFPMSGAGRDVWSIVSHGAGIIDLCGEGGHRRSIDGGAHWSVRPSKPLPGGRCSIAASPLDPDVLIATRDTAIYHTRDGGRTWMLFGPQRNHPDSGLGRLSSVATNARSDGTFDLWYGYAMLYRGACTRAECPVRQRLTDSIAGVWKEVGYAGGAHLDIGVVLFDPADSVDACPLLLSNDGGIERNTIATKPLCHTPRWVQPDVTPHALWVLGMQLTQILSTDSTVHDSTGGISVVPFNGLNTYHRIIVGTQDNGSFQTDRANATTVQWANTDPADAGDAVGDAKVTINSVCCFGADGSQAWLFLRDLEPGGVLGDTTAHRLLPPEGTQLLTSLNAIVRVSTTHYAILTDRGLFISGDVLAGSVRGARARPGVPSLDSLYAPWTALGWPTRTRPSAAGLMVAGDSANPVFFVRIDSAGTPSQLWRLSGAHVGGAAPRGIKPAGRVSWKRILPPDGSGGFGVVAVDRADPTRLFASNVRTGHDPRMMRTSDGGTSWTLLPALDACMVRNGTFRYTNSRGPTGIGTGKSGFDGYSQPTLVTYGSAMDSGRVLLAGAADAGIFASLDAGETWKSLTDPFAPQFSGIPHIPRPRYVRVADGPQGSVVYLGSQGRGVWMTYFPRRPRTVILAGDC